MTLTARPTRPQLGAIAQLWRNVRVQRAIFQLAFAVFIIWLVYILITNLTDELAKIDLEAFPFVERSGDFPFVKVHLDFLGQRAGFGIKETSFGFDYSANDRYADAYVVGVLNMLRVALIGIVLATVLGLVAGIARLSPNWLVSKIATVYVETFRNVPLLVQLIFWYTAVVLQAPPIGEAIHALGAIMSVKGVALPAANATDGFGLWSVFLAVALVAAIGVWLNRARRQQRTGRASYPWWSAAGTFVVIAAGGFILAGTPLAIDRPQVEGTSYAGGVQISPEFAAVLIALVVYTGTFIAEIVRGSILAIPKGQTEAAAAVGLNPIQRLRFVILPQALRIIMPPLTNQYLNLTKNSSLAVFVAYPDLFQVSRVTVNQTGQAVPIVILLLLTYLTMSLLTSLIMNVINSRLKVPSS
ncbi:MAG: ABC transporter permease subunit [Chloroflexi bacterium]|nr:ABC transporter permease subunit [Chloroflexota bacterium]